MNRLRRDWRALLRYGGGFGAFSFAMAIGICIGIARSGALSLVSTAGALAWSVAAAIWLTGRVYLTETQLVAGNRLRPTRWAIAEIERVTEGKVPVGRGFVDGLLLEFVDGESAQLSLSGNLSPEQRSVWIREISEAAMRIRGE